MLNAIEGEQTISINPNFSHIEMLQNPEVLILFKWVQGEPSLKDVDYFLWGDTTYGISKPEIG